MTLSERPVCVDLPYLNSSCSFIHSFFHSGYFYSTSSSPLLLRGAPETARMLCRSFTPKCHRQLRVKDLPKVPYVAARVEFEPSTLWMKGDESTNEPPHPTWSAAFRSFASSSMSTATFVQELLIL